MGAWSVMPLRSLTALLLIAMVVALGGCSQPKAEPERRLSPAAENRLRGQRYLVEHAQQPGVVTTASGLQYRVIKQGDGARPTIDDTVSVHYRGAFIDGREFETSRDRDQLPVQLPLRQVIRGWQEGVQLMPVGSIYEFTIPSHMAYGLDRAPERIGPNQTLVFTIELLAIVRG